MNYCSNCGEKIYTDDRFCGHCGTRIERPADNKQKSMREPHPDNKPHSSQKAKAETRDQKSSGGFLKTLLVISVLAACVYFAWPYISSDKSNTSSEAPKPSQDDLTEDRLTKADQYLYGVDVDPDSYEAFDLYQRAADDGNPEAMVQMYDYYSQGLWVPKDLAKAKRYLRKAADMGSLDAQWELEYLNSKDQ